MKKLTIKDAVYAQAWEEATEISLCKGGISYFQVLQKKHPSQPLQCVMKLLEPVVLQKAMKWNIFNELGFGEDSQDWLNVLHNLIQVISYLVTTKSSY